jgi:hypothetical protein
VDVVNSKIEKFREKIRQIYIIANELEGICVGRKFTPDGHMVGSIGEAIAVFEYGVELHPASHPGTDGVVNGREVQIKATQGTVVAVKKPSGEDLLLVIKIDRNGSWETVYAGAAGLVWDSLNHKEESYLRVKTISLKRLKVLQHSLNEKDVIPKVVGELS